EQAAHRVDQVIRMGTGAIEIKSGYGLTLEGELKMLRVIKRLSEEFPVPVKATFLGAHAFPAVYKTNQQEYIDILIREMIPAVAANGLADYIDVFCESGYFSVEQSVQIMKAGIAHGLTPKIHVNQFTAIGGIRAAVACDALSVDHLELITEDDIQALQGSRTMPVALPGCSFFISIPYTPGRQIISAGLPLALATDYNPGTAPSGNMNFAVGAACAKMKLLPAEAINAATINAAYAMGLSATHGTIARGKKANLMVTVPLPSYVAIPYEFANNPVQTIILNGKVYA
ncbi:MAG TPA: imidazolonepropionase, partial [Flavobacterium sp.]|nr:imidazolonepropionase [Flavobacterium sp.]